MEHGAVVTADDIDRYGTAEASSAEAAQYKDALRAASPEVLEEAARRLAVRNGWSISDTWGMIHRIRSGNQ